MICLYSRSSMIPVLVLSKNAQNNKRARTIIRALAMCKIRNYQ